jgi:two-component system nitrogen regulation response regulator NtrX
MDEPQRVSIMNETILVVDDEVSICQSLKAILSDEGYQVLVAGSGEEAVKLIEEEMPQLVLLDIWLPGMDGLETLKAIKKAHPKVLVIIMSGHGTIETAVKATKLGAFDFIEKPLSLDKIIILVNNAINLVRLKEENVLLKQKVSHQYELTGQSRGDKRT